MEKDSGIIFIELSFERLSLRKKGVKYKTLCT